MTEPVPPWPCDRRDAHGPHTIRVQYLTGPVAYGDEPCPGVRAHPATMIGRPPTTYYDDPNPHPAGIDLTTLNQMPHCPKHDPGTC